MPEISYRIRLSRLGYEFEAEGDKEFVLEMIKKFEISSDKFLQETKIKLSPLHDNASIPDKIESSKITSVGEFIRQLNLKKHTDIVLAFGFYLEKYSGLNEFAPADITKCYYESKLESSNTSQMIIQNFKRGYIMQAKGAGKEKRYTLTQSGMNYIESFLVK